jgi:hypothetical protein
MLTIGSQTRILRDSTHIHRTRQSAADSRAGKAVRKLSVRVNPGTSWMLISLSALRDLLPESHAQPTESRFGDSGNSQFACNYVRGAMLACDWVCMFTPSVNMQPIILNGIDSPQCSVFIVLKSDLSTPEPFRMKTNLKGKVVPLRSREAHLGDRRYSSYSFLTSALEGGEWSASRPGPIYPRG